MSGPGTWLAWLCVVFIVIGCALRFLELDHAHYWTDECHTLFRISGHPPCGSC
jgi:uncharacterized membrane protein